MSKIVIPVKDDLLSESFNACTYYLIYEIRDRKIVGKEIEFFPSDFRKAITSWTDISGITDVIVHQIDIPSIETLSSMKIDLFLGVRIDKPDRLVEDFLDGTLKSDTHHLEKSEVHCG